MQKALSVAQHFMQHSLQRVLWKCFVRPISTLLWADRAGAMRDLGGSSMNVAGVHGGQFSSLLPVLLRAPTRGFCSSNSRLLAILLGSLTAGWFAWYLLKKAAHSTGQNTSFIFFYLSVSQPFSAALCLTGFPQCLLHLCQQLLSSADCCSTPGEDKLGLRGDVGQVPLLAVLSPFQEGRGPQITAGAGGYGKSLVLSHSARPFAWRRDIRAEGAAVDLDLPLFPAVSVLGFSLAVLGAWILIGLTYFLKVSSHTRSVRTHIWALQEDEVRAGIISVWTEEAACGILPVSSAGSAPQHGDVGRKQPSSSSPAFLGWSWSKTHYLCQQMPMPSSIWEHGVLCCWVV